MEKSPSSFLPFLSPPVNPSPEMDSVFSQMPDVPPRLPVHRRARSEILSLPDDFSFDFDLGVVGGGTGDGRPSPSEDEDDDDVLSMFLDADMFPASSSAAADAVGALLPSMTERPATKHRHSLSMDGTTTSIKPELLASPSEGPLEARKATSAQQLADLALVDPKKAKRIWANRQSAARSKERKTRYIQDLERRVKTLEAETTTLAVQLKMLQNDARALTAENGELQLRLQTLEQQVSLQDVLNYALNEEVQRLKPATGQVMTNNGTQATGFVRPPAFGRVGQQQFLPPHDQAMQAIVAVQRLKQLQIHSQQLPLPLLPPHPYLAQLQHQQQPPPPPQQQQQKPPSFPGGDVRIQAMVAPPSRE